MVLKLVMARRLISTLATRSGLAVELAGDGVSDVGQLLLLLLEVLSGSGSGYQRVSIGSQIIQAGNKTNRSPRASPESP